METEWPEHFQPEVVREGYGGKLSSYTLALEAWRRGLEVTFLDSDLRQYTVTDSDEHSVKFTRSRPHMTTRQGVQAANDKHRTAQLLRLAGVPAPESVLIETATVDPTALCKKAEIIGYPIVLKPLDGSMGRGVFAGLRNSTELTDRYEDLMQSVAPKSAVLESHVPGDDYRVLVYDQTVVGVCLRLPANIVGDGRRTVRELIEEKNQRRRKNPFLSKGLIKPDHEVDDYLAREGQHYESIPAKDQYIRLRSAANASAGGDVRDVTDAFPDEIKQAAVGAVRAVPGLFCAGVDVLFEGGSTAIEGRYSVLELNAHPQIGVNMYPTEGTGQDAPHRIIDVCFPKSQRSDEISDKQLSLPRLHDLLWPLKTGSARAVTLGALPEHRLTTRRVYSFNLPTRFTVRQRNQLLRSARDHHLSGFVRRRQDRLEVLIAGQADGVETFIHATTRLLDLDDSEVAEPREWSGAVAPGFYIHQSLTTN